MKLKYQTYYQQEFSEFKHETLDPWRILNPSRKGKSKHGYIIMKLHYTKDMVFTLKVAREKNIKYLKEQKLDW